MIGTCRIAHGSAARFLFLAVIASVASLLSLGASADVVLLPPITFPAGNPDTVATADFDADGAVDVATDSAYWIFVLFGDGEGGVRETRSWSTGSQVIDLAVQDFDGDGRPDILSVEFRPDRLALYRNAGDGRFESRIESPLGYSSEAEERIDVADADGDGFLDVALTNSYDEAVAFGAGDGTFSNPRFLRLLSGVSGRTPRFADCNEDGWPDLVVLSNFYDPSTPPGTRYPLSVVVALGRGAARDFVASPPFQVDSLATQGQDLRIADIDSDGYADLLVAAFDRGVYALFGDGRGTFSESAQSITGGNASSLVLADFDGDHTLDFAAANTTTSRSVGVVLATGNRRFGTHVEFGTGRTPTSIAAADFDGDLHSDVIVATPETGVQVLLNRTPELCLAGNVNAGAGALADVVFVNDSPGRAGRRLVLATYEPFALFVAPPPLSTGSAPFALGVWRAEPTDLRFPLPFGVGSTCLPLHGASPAPVALFNNTGKDALGLATHPSAPAPIELVRRPRGLGRQLTFFVQGVIFDPGSAASRPASVTNGVAVEVR